VFTAPWPGPGDSEGPVDPEGWIATGEKSAKLAVGVGVDEGALFTAPWPGPGDSEGPVDAELGQPVVG
jgi:hypothetical protein